MATALWTLAAGAAASPQASREDGGSPPSPKAADPAVAGGLEVDLGDGVSMRFVEIKPGRFTMGSPEEEAGRDDDETQHEVTISKAFLLGQTEVTQAQWQAVMGTNPSWFKGNPNRPVEQVTWYDAIEFCNRLTAMANEADARLGLTPCYRISKIERAEGGGQIGIGPIRSAEVELIEGANGYRLPTEAEWEYACRAGTTTAYSFGNDRSRLGEYGWFYDNSGESTHPVATKRSNGWGLFDMHGNMLEWCWDWYGEYPSVAVTDPQGQRSGTARVLRGGCWAGISDSCRAGRRDRSDPSRDFGLFGFRVARSVPTKPATAPQQPEAADVTTEVHGVGVCESVLSRLAAMNEDPASTDSKSASGLEVDLGDGVSMRFVEIDSGRFTMGSPESEAGRDDDEAQHSVTISKAFLLGQTEVTQAQWQAVMGTNPSKFKGNSNHPVEQVTWYDAIEFCNRLTAMANEADARLGLTPCYRISKIERAEGGAQSGSIRSAEVELIEAANGYRLPTEAEWEYACRAGTTTAWSFGNDRSRLGEHAWFASNSGKEPFDADAMVSEGDVRAFFQKLSDNRCSTKPVATRKPNAWGLFDMHGNVWEWCWDWYGEYPSGSASDPDGPRSGARRVLRGGSWLFASNFCRASNRGVNYPGGVNINRGFRAARTP